MDDDDIVAVCFARCLHTICLKADCTDIPTTETEWQRWCELENVVARRWPRRLTPIRVRGRLSYHTVFQQWFIMYSVHLSPADRCRTICHELFEFMAARDMVQNLEEYIKAPAELPHLVGVRAEEYCCNGAQLALPLVTVRATMRRGV